jgi:hypothetical protein
VLQAWWAKRVSAYVAVRAWGLSGTTPVVEAARAERPGRTWRERRLGFDLCCGTALSSLSEWMFSRDGGEQISLCLTFSRQASKGTSTGDIARPGCCCILI